ncbi:MAG: ABC transporter ATP-binding protein [Bdellovibrionales bacterium]
MGVILLAVDQNTTVALHVDSVVKHYGTVAALTGVTLSVDRGEVFGLLGPNGAGKTSLISIIVTLERATNGQVSVFGWDVVRSPREAKLRTGWVPQEIISHGFFDVREILKFHAGYYGVAHPKERIDYLLQGLGLWEHRHKKVKQLSGGMKRRLMIAKALVHSPGLLLLDEPTAGVDVELRTKLWDFVEELKSQGVSILLTTHYLEEAERLCDRVAIIHRGELRAMGKTRGLIEQWSRKCTVLQLVNPVSQLSHPDLVGGQGAEWTFLTAMDKTLGQLLQELRLSASELADVRVREGNLEDVFMRLTQKEVPT